MCAGQERKTDYRIARAQAYMDRVLTCMDRPCGWYKAAHLQNLDLQGKWKGRYGEALLFDLLRAADMFFNGRLHALSGVDRAAAYALQSADWQRAFRVCGLVRQLAWGCYGRVWYARNVRERHLVREHFKQIWTRLQAAVHIKKDDCAWMWDPNAKNFENFFMVSIVTCTDLQLNDGAIIEMMHIAFKKVRHAVVHVQRDVVAHVHAGEPQGVRLRPARRGRAGARRAARKRRGGRQRAHPRRRGDARRRRHPGQHPAALPAPGGEPGGVHPQQGGPAPPPRVAVRVQRAPPRPLRTCPTHTRTPAASGQVCPTTAARVCRAQF